MVKTRKQQDKYTNKQYSVSGDILRGYIEDSCIPNAAIVNVFTSHAYHSETHSAFLRFDSTQPDLCTSIAGSNMYSQFACFTLERYEFDQPIWPREYGCLCIECKEYNFRGCKNISIVGEWKRFTIRREVYADNSSISRKNFRLQLNKKLKSILSTGKDIYELIIAIAGAMELTTEDTDAMQNKDGSFWLASPLSKTTKATHKIDPMDKPGDIISKDCYCLKVRYYQLKPNSSYKYVFAEIQDAIVDYDNVIITADLEWDRVFREGSFQINKNDGSKTIAKLIEHWTE